MANIELDLDELERRIEGIVDRAVSPHDYQKLNYTIRQMVEKAVDAGNEAVRRVSDSAVVTELRQNNPQLPAKRLYGRIGGRTAVGIVKTVIGGELSLAGVTFLVLSLALSGSLVGAALSTALLGGSLCLMSSGIRNLAQLITTLDDVMKIQSEGRAKRLAAEAEMLRMENELKGKLLQISNGGQ